MSLLAVPVLLQLAATMRPAGVAYVITNTTNGKRYVGITKRSPEARWAAHKRRVPSQQQRPLYRAMLKHGLDAFAFEVVASARSMTDLWALERMLVAQYGTFWSDGAGYNLTKGGDGPVGHRHTEETRAKMSSTRKGRPHSEAHRIALADAMKPIFGAAIAAAKIANTGRPRSPEVQLMLRGLRLGTRLTEEHRQRISQANRARGREISARVKEQFTGKPLSEAHKERLRYAAALRGPDHYAKGVATRRGRATK